MGEFDRNSDMKDAPQIHCLFLIDTEGDQSDETWLKEIGKGRTIWTVKTSRLSVGFIHVQVALFNLGMSGAKSDQL